MADKIDKSLSTVKETVHVESPEEIQIEETQKLQEISDDGVDTSQPDKSVFKPFKLLIKHAGPFC